MSEGFFRGRRLRQTPEIRNLVRETVLGKSDLIQPYFVIDHPEPEYTNQIASMPGQSQLGLSALLRRVEEAMGLGLQALILFGIPAEKDDSGSPAYAEDGIIQRAVGKLKENFPKLTVITDVCLCEYTAHGHCGIVQNGKILNDPTLEILARTALSHVQAGADIVAPSDMMDGRVKVIRELLDKEGYTQVPLMSYAVKYASSFYGPFRDAAQSTPEFGDRRSYQMDSGNSREAMREAEADVAEGADLLIVKPALPYLDVLARIRQAYNLPLAAYQVSGEYSMIKAASARGWLNEQEVVLESLTSMKRAGADLILSYFSETVLPLLS